MRKYAFPLAAACLLFPAMILRLGLQSGNALSTTPSIHQGNLVISGNTLTVLEGRFDINGSIIVEQNATLLLRDAILNFTQKGRNHNITLQNPAAGSPRLIAYNSTVSSNGYALNLFLLGNSSGRVEKSLIAKEINIRLKAFSSLVILNSTIHFMDLNNVASCQMTGCSATKGMVAYDSSSLRILHCLIPYVVANDDSTVEIRDSNINQQITVTAHSANFSVEGLRPTFVNYWNVETNCSVSLAPGGIVPNITITDTQVGGWYLSIYGLSHVTVSESELHQVRTDGHSTLDVVGSSLAGAFSSYAYAQTHFFSSSLRSVLCSSDSQVWMWNCTAGPFETAQRSGIYICQRLDVNVVDSIGCVPGANVTANHQDGTRANSALTDSAGIARLLLAQRILNATGWRNAGAYQVRADHAGRSTSAAVDLNATREITLTLVGAPIGEIILPASMLLMPTLAVVSGLGTRARTGRH